MSRFFPHFGVVIGGACVLSLEILGTRVIGPFAGVGLYVWSALIGVTLAALSVGYALGGRWADRGADLRRFSLLFVASGAWVLIMPWLRHPVIDAAEGLGLRSAVLLSSTVLFFPPLFVLGMVSPYAIKLQTESLDVVGRTAGNLYALSTLASVAAAIGTGFFLIPRVGVTRLLFLIGILLVGTGLVGLVTDRRRAAGLAGCLLLPVALAGAYRVAPVDRPDPDAGLLAVEDSAYAEIRVLDRDGLRYMLIDGATHTVCDPADWVSEFQYVHVLEIAKRLKPIPGRMLLVGLGGGSVVKSFHAEGWRVETVEIDPVVTDIARAHFGLLESEGPVYHRDGRRFVAEQPPGTYDLIVVDAFGSSSIPFHLVTREAFALVRSRLAPGGLLAMNIEGVGWHDILVHSLGNTLAEVFGEVQVLPIAEPPDRLGNLVLLAADWPLEVFEEPEGPTSRWSFQYDLVHAWDNRFEPRLGAAPVLTDDLNPVDLWSDRINLVARDHLHEYFGEGGGDR